MAEKLFRKETVTCEELLTSNVIEQEALINLSVLLLSRIARLRKFYEYRRWPPFLLANLKLTVETFNGHEGVLYRSLHGCPELVLPLP